MAYMSQDRKKEIHKNLKPVLKKWGLKGTLSVDNHSTLVLKIKSGDLDLLGDLNWHNDTPRDHCDVNPYHYRTQFKGDSRDAIGEILAVMNDGNWDKSDIMTDYHNVGWYVDIKIGKWNKPYIFNGEN